MKVEIVMAKLNLKVIRKRLNQLNSLIRQTKVSNLIKR